jgi:hypothetical protein
MWFCGSDFFLSIVDNSTTKGELLVRGRRKGDIEKVFPNATVIRKPGRDYLYRASIDRCDVAKAMFSQVMNIDYPNFKNSVKNKKLHDCYADVWGVMASLQEIPPYSVDKSKSSIRKLSMFPIDDYDGAGFGDLN